MSTRYSHERRKTARAHAVVLLSRVLMHSMQSQVLSEKPERDKLSNVRNRQEQVTMSDEQLFDIFRWIGFIVIVLTITRFKWPM